MHYKGELLSIGSLFENKPGGNINCNGMTQPQANRWVSNPKIAFTKTLFLPYS